MFKHSKTTAAAELRLGLWGTYLFDTLHIICNTTVYWIKSELRKCPFWSEISKLYVNFIKQLHAIINHFKFIHICFEGAKIRKNMIKKNVILYILSDFSFPQLTTHSHIIFTGNWFKCVLLHFEHEHKFINILLPSELRKTTKKLLVFFID